MTGEILPTADAPVKTADPGTWQERAIAEYERQNAQYEKDTAEREEREHKTLEENVWRLLAKLGIGVDAAVVTHNLVHAGEFVFHYSFSSSTARYGREHISPLVPCESCGDYRFGPDIDSPYALGAFLKDPQYNPCTQEDCPPGSAVAPLPTRETPADRMMSALREIISDVVSEDRP